MLLGDAEEKSSAIVVAGMSGLTAELGIRLVKR
jgi:hypothetical protein